LSGNVPRRHDYTLWTMHIDYIAQRHLLLGAPDGRDGFFVCITSRV
jgi:hypothetical protein